MEPSPSTSDTTLEAARRRRAELRMSMGAVEQALASPAVGREPAWTQRVHVALVELSADLREHITVTEEPLGLYRSVLEAAPRLGGRVARLTRDHVRLRTLLDDLIVRTDDGTVAAVPDVRRATTALLARLARHRQQGADLVWEAYEVDIGSGE